MEITGLLENLVNRKKNIDEAIRLVKNIDHLNGDLAANLFQLRSNLTKLEKLASECSKQDPVFQTILVKIEIFEKEIAAKQESLKDQFGITLERELIPQGYTLKGNHPIFTAGFFTIEINHRKWSSKIWYGPKQELLDTCSFSASLVSLRIKISRENLGANMDERSFLDLLYKTYTILAGGRLREPVPINKILVELAKSLNPVKPESQKNTSHTKTKVYGRADFSYDLFRSRNFPGHPELVVATRAFSQKREDFLWAPMDEYGKGATYSHLKFQEKRND